MWVELSCFVAIECIFGMLFYELLAEIHKCWTNVDGTAFHQVSLMLQFLMERVW